MVELLEVGTQDCAWGCASSEGSGPWANGIGNDQPYGIIGPNRQHAFTFGACKET